MNGMIDRATKDDAPVIYQAVTHRISMIQKRMCTSSLPQYNLSHPEFNKHCTANSHTLVHLVLVVVWLV
jgi:hypothetical protein